jgi:DNA-binding CsgD family transcriptional regulator
LKSIKIIKKILLIFALVFIDQVVGQEIPPIKHHKPAVSFAGNQNWMITQDQNGIIFTANNKGLLQFGGEEWELDASPNQSIIRSVKVIDNRICVGSYMDFGYWERLSNGELNYTSLAEKLNVDIIDDEQFWNIIEYGERIIFQSLNRLVITDIANKELQFINAENTLLKSFKVDNKIYFQESGKGLYEVRGGRAFLVNEGQIIKENVIVGLYKKDGKFLVVTDKSGFYFLEDNQLTKWAINAEKKIDGFRLYSSIELSDGSYALGTISNGLFIIDTDGNNKITLNKGNGITNNTVLSMFEDQNKNLWLGLDNGVDCINVNSPFREYNDNDGKIGAVYASAEKGNYFYLGTNHGLFYRIVGQDGGFKLIPGTEGQVWSLNKFDDALFCGHDIGTFYVDRDKAFRIGDTQGTWTFKRHPKDNNKLLQGNYNGIHVLEKQGNKWKYKNKLTGFDISSRFFEVVNDSILLVGHEYKGVFRLDVDAAYSQVISSSMDTSVQKGMNASLAKFDNQIFYFNPSGIYLYDRDQLQFNRDPTLSDEIQPEDYLTGKMINDENGRLWMFSQNRIHFLRREVFSEKLKFESIFFEDINRKSVMGFEHIRKYADSKYLIAADIGYLILDIDKKVTIDPKIKINKIRVRDNEKGLINIPLENDFEFDYERNNVQFFFTATNYQKYQNVKYQYRLEGYDLMWSPWSNISNVSYSNLPKGSYRFTVRSMIGDQISKESDSLSFYIKPPWHLSRWMYMLYITVGIILLIFINKIYDVYYERERIKLINSNQRKLKINELATQRKLVEFKNEKLQNDIENKNREIAIATMSRLKRNEFLNKVIDELNTIEAHPRINRLIKTIKKNLKGNEDWEFFEKAFNNADKDFLKKIKEAHPTLTHNDLRLCAFLRLNLLSKEIAPLLNISVRSVEIKRYRLRKKMNLSRDETILDHIVNL